MHCVTDSGVAFVDGPVRAGPVHPTDSVDVDECVPVTEEKVVDQLSLWPHIEEASVRIEQVVPFEELDEELVVDHQLRRQFVLPVECQELLSQERSLIYLRVFRE